MKIVVGNIEIENVNIKNWDTNGNFFVIDKDVLRNISEHDSSQLNNYIKYGAQIRFVNEIGFSQIKYICNVIMDDNSIKCYYR